MNQDRLSGICKQASGQLMEYWGAFTNDARVSAAGRRERVAGGIQERRGICAQQADLQLEAFLIRHRNWQDI